MNSRVYDILKWVAIIVLPALSTLISVVFQIWNIPFGAEISQTITAIATFLGAILMVSSIQYTRKLKQEQDLLPDNPDVN